ncbi:uncharacterized protein TNCV_4504211 [Trichonephila clavipes]|nr:uncharacterized protein TNCV_4504211 [Trichonephila clavipes]
MIYKEFGDRRLFIEPGRLPKPETQSFFECVTTDVALAIEGALFMDGEKLQPLLVTGLEHLKSEANPQVYVETSLHPEKLTVWCALWAGGIFFKNDEGYNVTVNGDRYRAMITNFFIPELNNHDVRELWFQQDGATCDTARATIDLLKDTFGDRLIARLDLGIGLQDLLI